MPGPDEAASRPETHVSWYNSRLATYCLPSSLLLALVWSYSGAPSSCCARAASLLAVSYCCWRAQALLLQRLALGLVHQALTW